MRAAGFAVGLVALILVVGVAGTPRTSSAANVMVSLDPASQYVHEGDTVKVSLSVKDVSHLAAYEAILEFDDSILSFDTFADAGFLATTGRNVICPAPFVDHGTVQFGCATKDLTPDGPGGDAVLGTLEFSAHASGVSPLVFINLELANPNGDDCCGTPSVGEGIVQVLGTGVPAPPSLLATPPSRPLGARSPVAGSTPVAGLRLPNSSGANDPSSGAGGSGGSTGGSAGVATGGGSQAGGASGAAGQNFPHSGTGPEPQHRSALPGVIAAVLGGFGLFLITVGARTYEGWRKKI